MRKRVILEREVRQYLHRWEHDACALMAAVARDGHPSHSLVETAAMALASMVHRSGDVDGEGDGCGLQLDLPKTLWGDLLAAAGEDSSLSQHPYFGVAHLFLPKAEAYWADGLLAEVKLRMVAEGFSTLALRRGRVHSGALGPRASEDEPFFYQVAFLAPGDTKSAAEAACFGLSLALEAESTVHVVSCSTETVIYKVRGDAHALLAYYEDLRDERLTSRAVIGHNRYSTNTATVFERVQPFSLLGHNGEINTIAALREQMRQVAIDPVRDGSDSQDLNRALAGLIYHYGIDLPEAMEMLFPPILGEVRTLSAPLQDLYMRHRHTWGPFAQGPAAVAARAGNYLVGSVDALGLRPLWVLETDQAYFLSSEPGIVSPKEMLSDPRPLGPGEKVAFRLRSGAPEVIAYPALRQQVARSAANRLPDLAGDRQFLHVGGPQGSPDEVEPLPAFPGGAAEAMPQERLLAAMGWSGEDTQLIRSMAAAGVEPIGSLGYDGPLACLCDARQNLADYFKESVAVVTNPAIDREREIEHFSTRTVLGERPTIAGRHAGGDLRVELRLPVLVGGHRSPAAIPLGEYRNVARGLGTYLLEDLFAYFGESVHQIDLTFPATETIAQALTRLAGEAVQAVRGGARLLLLDDAASHHGGRLWLDPHLLVSAIHRALVDAVLPTGEVNLRRRCGIVLRSGAIRSLHDLALAKGLGADGINPYLMLELAADGELPAVRLERLVGALHKGLEKVISTLGIHELRGYGRCFSHIGLRPELAGYFGCPGFMGSAEGGLSPARLKADAGERYRMAGGDGRVSLARVSHIWPKVWKAAGESSQSPESYEAYRDRLRALERESPVSLRHLLDCKPAMAPVPPEQVDTRIEDYRYPVTISAMSFGSQGEVAFRAYAEAAKRLDIVCMNGEGGEIPDMVGRYFKWRGQQVASGRFGVHAAMLCGSRFIEIKVGQGAKPGEGGHLPGSKVTAKVALARNASRGVDLISPSNNHDIYSIEDLAQLVEELKTTNPLAKIVVKVPVVPGIGTIAVGIAKSGADIVALCGYDGGTGAARKHALRHAGLPIEIGVREAHLALVAAGIRSRVEIWGDSGIKSGEDVVKLMLLGANRVGFGTLAMVAIGCTICRGCQLDTCHVGIATQIESLAEAREKGLKAFSPRVFEEAVERLVSLFTAIGEEVRDLTGQLGFARTQDLVGRAELLSQTRGHGRVDLGELILPVVWEGKSAHAAESVRQAGASHLTREMATVAAGLMARGESQLRLNYPQVGARDRAVGSALAGEIVRAGDGKVPLTAAVDLTDGSIAGNGLAAFGTQGLSIRVDGGAQDGVGKGMLGGKVVILKTRNHRGGWVGGAVGKSFGYGAQEGLFIVQGDADARCGIRLSGADLIVGGSLKGFAFEYMTRGRAVVLGDPGPWICSGMSGGVVYVRLQPVLGLDEAAIGGRLAKGAKVMLGPLVETGQKDVAELLSTYHQELLQSGQMEAAAELLTLLMGAQQQFVAIFPAPQQVDPRFSTE